MSNARLQRILARIFGIMGTLLLGADFVLESHYAVTRPRIADVDAGRIYPLNVHGIVYVTSREHLYIHILETAAATCVLGLALVVYLEIRRRKRGVRVENISSGVPQA